MTVKIKIDRDRCWILLRLGTPILTKLFSSADSLPQIKQAYATKNLDELILPTEKLQLYCALLLIQPKFFVYRIPTYLLLEWFYKID